MDFASDYAYANNNDDEFDDDAGDDDMASDLMSNIAKAPKKKAAFFSAPPAKAAVATTTTSATAGAAIPTPPPVAPAAAALAAQKRRLAARADTNVVAVKFGSLAKAADSLVAGDPVHCRECRAVFSLTSSLLSSIPTPTPTPAPSSSSSAIVSTASTPVTESSASIATPPGGAPTEEKKAPAPITLEDGQKLWICEFCSTHNAVEIEDGEMPTTESRDFLLEAGASEAKGDGKAREGGGAVIFAVDISGSMCSTTEVPGNFKLKGQRAAPTFNIPGYGRQPQQVASKSTYVSRLQCVQASIDQQIEYWSKDVPTKQVSLITFNHEVTILGDGISDPEVVTGDKLHDQKQLTNIGNARAAERSVKEASSALSTKLFALEETGQTALGPALCIAVAMAAKRGAGSRVVVCTDGKANVGLGSLDGITNDDERDHVRRWYEGIGNYAALHGVIISVISIKGAEASLEDLGRVSEITGGTVDRVDPISLTKDFGSMLANPVIATHVSATFQLHRGLCFRNEDSETSKLTRDIGNVTEDSEITFEYQMKVGASAEQFKELKSLPFQLQIHFTKLDGSKCMRVISKSQQVTSQREVAERGARVHLMAANVAQKSAAMADRGDYDGARRNNLKWGRVLNRSAQDEDQRESYGAWLQDTEGFDRSLQQQQVSLDRRLASKPAAAPVPTSSAGAPPSAAASSTGGGGFLSSLFGSKSAVTKEARNMRDDSQYMEINKFKQKSSNAYAKRKVAAPVSSAAVPPPASTVTAPVTSAPPAKVVPERKK